MTMPDAAPVLSNSDIAELTDWRRELHRHPELSGEERETAARVCAMLEPTAPDEVMTGLGRHGIAAIYAGTAPGPTVLLRCELDGLPIREENDALPHCSQTPGKGHLCGHDGHMAILTATARWLGRNRPRTGRVVLLYQPAEEDGSGAEKVIADPRFATISPDFAFALHNFPGLPLGHAMLSEGPANCASRGMRIVLRGRTAHASQPETGTSPAPAMARLVTELTALGTGGKPTDPAFSLVTVTHARLGEPAFGIAPGEAELWVTLRTQRDAGMDALVSAAEAAVADAAGDTGLGWEITYRDVFRHCENDPEATRILREALAQAGVPLREADGPLRGSEDFGRFGDHARAAMFLLGSGSDLPSLHNPDYDFPDALIPVGARVFARVVLDVCGDG
ncbi:MAG: amidohydrolase [Rhodobacteraceae bacterium]|nr:amidohydrolase [Paracoccaceae bacterium]